MIETTPDRHIHCWTRRDRDGFPRCACGAAALANGEIVFGLVGKTTVTIGGRSIPALRFDSTDLPGQIRRVCALTGRGGGRLCLRCLVQLPAEQTATSLCQRCRKLRP